MKGEYYEVSKLLLIRANVNIFWIKLIDSNIKRKVGDSMEAFNRKIVSEKIDFCKEIGNYESIPIIKTDKGYYVFEYDDNYIFEEYKSNPKFFETKEELEDRFISLEYSILEEEHIVKRIKKENPHLNILEVRYFEA